MSKYRRSNRLPARQLQSSRPTDRTGHRVSTAAGSALAQHEIGGAAYASPPPVGVWSPDRPIADSPIASAGAIQASSH